MSPQLCKYLNVSSGIMQERIAMELPSVGHFIDILWHAGEAVLQNGLELSAGLPHSPLYQLDVFTCQENYEIENTYSAQGAMAQDCAEALSLRVE
jgi:hypothetical protein